MTGEARQVSSNRFWPGGGLSGFRQAISKADVPKQPRCHRPRADGEHRSSPVAVLVQAEDLPSDGESEWVWTGRIRKMTHPRSAALDRSSEPTHSPPFRAETGMSNFPSAAGDLRLSMGFNAPQIPRSRARISRLTRWRCSTQARSYISSIMAALCSGLEADQKEMQIFGGGFQQKDRLALSRGFIKRHATATPASCSSGI